MFTKLQMDTTLELKTKKNMKMVQIIYLIYYYFLELLNNNNNISNIIF